MEDLSNFSDKDYGYVYELPSSNFVVFGLITFWIYTAWYFYKNVYFHFSKRIEYFNDCINNLNFDKSINLELKKIINKGFSINYRPRNISIFCYFLSMFCVFTYQIIIYIFTTGEITEKLFAIFSIIVIGIASSSFTIGNVLFFTWASNRIKEHEYIELLLVKLIKNPESFSIVQPSLKFIQRWNNKKNKINLFIILSIPLTISPLIAVWHVNHLNSPNNHSLIVLLWCILIFSCAAVFHIWGTSLLLSIFNDHMRIEEINFQYLNQDNKWSSNVADNTLSSSHINEPRITSNTNPKRALLALMITDMVGFSKEMEKDEELTYSKLLIHNKIIRKIISENNGSEIKTIGDAFLVKFQSAVDAVRSAITIQNDIKTFNISNDDKILIRIGVHIGDVLLLGNDVIGNGVNVTARIEPISEPGGICISDSVYKLINNLIDVEVNEIGTHQLKNIKDPITLFQIILR